MTYCAVLLAEFSEMKRGNRWPSVMLAHSFLHVLAHSLRTHGCGRDYSRVLLAAYTRRLRR